jgi:hypothetical protein
MRDKKAEELDRVAVTFQNYVVKSLPKCASDARMKKAAYPSARATQTPVGALSLGFCTSAASCFSFRRVKKRR